MLILVVSAVNVIAVLTVVSVVVVKCFLKYSMMQLGRNALCCIQELLFMILTTYACHILEQDSVDFIHDLIYKPRKV